MSVTGSRLGLTLGLLLNPTLTDIETHRRLQTRRLQDRHAVSMAGATRQRLTEGSPFMECVESCTD